MKRALKFAAYVTVLSLATVVVFAGPCEEGCLYTKNQCDSQAHQSATACMAPAEQDRQTCLQSADFVYNDCITHRPYDPCNMMWENDTFYCQQTYWWTQDYCANQEQMDLTDCNNNYENCLFACQ